MDFIIRPMKKSDAAGVINMMRVFYASPAVFTNGSEEIFKTNVNACLNKNHLLKGYVFEKDDNLIGFAMTVGGFSTEKGSECVWVEDLYIKEEFRHNGIGGAFLEFIKSENKNAVIKLEVEPENERAINAYTKHGFKKLPYFVMRTDEE